MTVDLAEIDALLFDLGGVVIDIDFSRVFDSWAQRSNSDPSEIASRFSMDEAYRRHEVGEIDGPTYFGGLRTSLQIDLSDRDFVAGWLEVHIGVAKGIDEVLTGAACSWPLFGFTNTNPTHRDVAAVRFAEVLEHFETVFESFTIGLRKPEREAFEFVADSMGVPPERILFFDDSAENVQGALDCGMPSVLVRSIEDIRSALRSGPAASRLNHGAS